MGKTITHCGPVGSGQATKACNQVLCAIHMLALCEAMALAAKEGLDLEKMLAVTSAGAGGSWALSNLGPRIAKGDMAPGFMIDLANKDMNIVYQEALNLNLPMPGIRLTSELYRAAAALGHGRDGTQAMARVFEKLGGFRYHPNT
jgi:3-hydroxyisobutyrate dehydrogenase